MIVEFYETANGKIPVNEYLDSLQPKLLAKTIRNIVLLERFGIELRLPFSEYLRDDIFELRSKQSSNITRILYFFTTDNKAILANGFTKKSIKTPKKEIETAIKYKTDYERRFNKWNFKTIKRKL